jgi:hypothetical protein
MRAAIHFTAIFCVFAANNAHADEAQDYERLRTNSQYAAAAELAQSRLDRSDLSPRERAEWCVQYIRARTEQALDTPPDRREAAWQDAQKEAESFIDRNASNPALLLARVQAALSLLARGESGALELRLLPKEVVSTQAVTHDLTVAIAALEKVSRGVGAALTALDQKKSPPPDGLSRPELVSLEKHLRLQFARAYRLLTECFAVKSPEAIDAVQQARDQLEPLLTLPPSSNLGWRSRIEESRLLVTEAKPREAYIRLVDLKRAKLSAEAVAQIDAQCIRILLAQGQVDEALRLSRESSSDRATAELQLARLEVIVAAYTRQPGDSTNDADELIAVMNNIAVRAPSWRRRAELVVTPAAYQNAKLAEGASPELLALRSIRDGKIEEALATYDRAATKAKQEMNSDRLFAATKAAARLEAGEKRLEAASKRCRRNAIENSTHEQVAAAHLWAIEYARQRLRTEKSPPPGSMEDFHKLLAEHVEHWPGDTADAVKSLQKQLVD